MHMVLIGSYLNERYLIALCYFQTDFFQHLVHFLIYDRMTILGRANEMVQQYRDIMAFPYQLTHAPILAQQAAGERPSFGFYQI